VRLCIEGGAFLWAAGRHEVPARLRLALQVTGWTSLASAVNYLALLPPEWGGPVLVPDLANSGLSLLSYLGGLAALLIYPRSPARPGERASLVIDLLITTGGLGVLSWVLVTLPSVATLTSVTERYWVLSFGVAQLAMLIGINLVIVRGQVVPSRRAFWWFVVGQATYIPVVLLTQLESAAPTDPRWSTAIYFWGVLPTLAAALAMRGDPITAAPRAKGPVWIRDFNPLPLVATAAVGACLLFLLTIGAHHYALAVAATLVAVSLLLAVRLLLSAHHSARLVREEADKERRQHAEKLQAVGRLAGGVAHDFNNLMARVVGHAELGEASLGPDAPARENLARVKVAALRAAELTRQLLAFSGRQRSQLASVEVEPAVRAVLQAAMRTLPTTVVASLQVGPGQLAVYADAAQFGTVVEQLIENAVDAMPRGGVLDVNVAFEQLHEPLATPQIPVPAGRYLAISVRDTGVGIAPELLAVVCDPFYSTKPPHLAAGLGLASVHGIMASHSGGLLIDSSPGEGTRVVVYWPAQ
ncbi:MAG: ATP-binding protein, partial [Acidobacteriota bacterium]